MDRDKDREGDDWYICYYLRRINRKMNWILIFVMVAVIAKSVAWLLPSIQWVMSLFTA